MCKQGAAIPIEFIDGALPHSHTTNIVKRRGKHIVTLHFGKGGVSPKKRLCLLLALYQKIPPWGFGGGSIPDFDSVDFPILRITGRPSQKARRQLQALPIGSS